VRRPDTLEPDEKTGLDQVRDRCPQLDALAGYVTDFATMLTARMESDSTPRLRR
jgi:hypothetical protein